MDEREIDRELVENAQKGDDEALRVLFGRHMNAVYGFLVRMLGSASDADDVTQETFIRLWKHLGKFDTSKSFRTWAFGIAHNAAIDHLRKRKHVTFSAFDTEDGGNAMVDTLEDDADLPDEVLERKQAAEQLRAALDKLPPEYREVVLLRTDGELQFNEIGEALGAPLDTVKSRYRRALAMLRKLLE